MKTKCAECGGKGAKPGKHRIGALCEACDGWGVVESGPVSERSEALEAKGIPSSVESFIAAEGYRAEDFASSVKERKQDSTPKPPTSPVGAQCPKCGRGSGAKVPCSVECFVAAGYKAEGFDAYIIARIQKTLTPPAPPPPAPPPPPPAPELEEGELTAEEVLRRFSSEK